jgi:hypothetical protein
MNTCIIEVGDKEYTLCLTREAVKEIEKLGFNIQDFMNKPITYMDLLWYGGFIPKHKTVSQNLSLKIMETYKEEGGDINEVIEFLASEYSNFVNAPTDTKAKKKAKIVKAETE